VTDGPIAEFFVNRNRAKLVMFFLAHPFDDYCIKEIAYGCGMTRQTVAKNIDDLLRFKLIKVRRKIYNTTLYKTNHRSKVYKSLSRLNDDLGEIILEGIK
jgi:hypothetical protein